MAQAVTSRGGYVAARLVNVVLGLWLIISVFTWPHNDAQTTNTWISGVLCTVFELCAFFDPVMRRFTTALASWLFVSAWALPTNDLHAMWNNILVAIAIFCVSWVPFQFRARDVAA